MDEHEKKTSFWPLVLISVALLAGVAIWAAVKPHQQQNAADQHDQQHEYQHTEKYQKPGEQFNKNEQLNNSDYHTQNNSDYHTQHSDNTLSTEPQISLNDIVKAARTWGPAYTSWYGHKAPEVSLTDIDRKLHKLSDYRGKNVMLIFWATWCGPCVMEVPHLIALRNLIGKDQLEMLAVSYENPRLVKSFARKKNINYTVISTDISRLPSPYNSIRSLPSGFIIDPDGNIKLATEGVVSLGEMKAILQSKWQ